MQVIARKQRNKKWDAHEGGIILFFSLRLDLEYSTLDPHLVFMHFDHTQFDETLCHTEILRFWNVNHTGSAFYWNVFSVTYDSDYKSINDPFTTSSSGSRGWILLQNHYKRQCSHTGLLIHCRLFWNVVGIWRVSQSLFGQVFLSHNGILI